MPQDRATAAVSPGGERTEVRRSAVENPTGRRLLWVPSHVRRSLRFASGSCALHTETEGKRHYRLNRAGEHASDHSDKARVARAVKGSEQARARLVIEEFKRRAQIKAAEHEAGSEGHRRFSGQVDLLTRLGRKLGGGS